MFAVAKLVAEAFIVCVSCRVVSTDQISSGQPYKLLGSCPACRSQPSVSYLWEVTRDDNTSLHLNTSTSTTGE